MAKESGRCGPGWLDLLHAICVLAALLAPVSAIEIEDEDDGGAEEAAVGESDDEEKLEPWEAFEDAVSRLRDDDPNARRQAADAALGSLLDVDTDEDPDAEGRVQEALSWLWATLQADWDDWNATHFLRSLMGRDLPIVERIFLDALTSPSGNVRAGAIARFAWKKDRRARGRLEALWETESRPWVRADLMEAFIELGSTRYAEDFRRLSHSEDGETALAAIRALAALRIEDADRDLVEVIRQASSDAAAIAAIEGLERFPASEVALDAVLDASRTDRPPVRNAAFRALGAGQVPEAWNRLLEAASTEVEESSCDAIREGLMGFQGEAVTRALAGMLRWAVGEQSRCLADLVESLHRRDDPTVLAEITDLVTAVEPTWRLTVNGLAAYLARDRAAPPTEEGPKVIACDLGGRPLDPLDPSTRRVRPASPARSIRCYDAPDGLDGVEYRGRVPEAALARVTARFERPDELWLEVHVEGWWTCWLRDSDLERLAPEDALLANDAEAASRTARDAREPERYEFDGDADELSAPGAVVLQEAGLLEIVEPGAPVVGLVFPIDDLEAMELARSICKAGGCGTILLDALEDRESQLRNRRARLPD